MEGLFFLLIVMVVGCLACGPIALIVGIIALNKTKRMYQALSRGAEPPVREKVLWPGMTQEKGPEPKIEQRPPEAAAPEPVVEQKEVAPEPATTITEHRKVIAEPTKAPGDWVFERRKKSEGRQSIELEQQIGTRWVLYAGIITVIFAVGFFLKYAYDTNLIGPTGRVAIAALAGLAALAIGEITRKRGYGIVARAVTALGFAILYAVVFSAYRYYNLIGSTPAFVLAILVTAAAMLYAVSMNEVVAAFLSLLGGFLTPAIVSTGQNMPIPLFCYVLVLGVGAMLCAYYRKWRAVDVLAFVGTFLLYIGWFEKFYRPAARPAEGMPEQMPVALVWLGIFFVVYLVLPILHQLIRKVKAQKEDVCLVLANAVIVFYYLWTILYARYRTELAFCVLALCAAHLVMMTVVSRRCKDDLDLRLALLVIGLFFVTIAVPLYLRMYAVAIAWAVEGAVLAVIGLRYRSILTQCGGGIALVLSLGQLLHQLPMHTGAFRLAFNPAFSTWCFVAGVLLVCHIIYRRTSQLEKSERGPVSEVLYAAGIVVLMAAATLEWYWHCDYNVADSSAGERLFLKGMVIISAILMPILLVRPLRPPGTICRAAATIAAPVASAFIILVFKEFYGDNFIILANVEFIIALTFVASLFISGWLLNKERDEDQYNQKFALAYVLAGIFVLWVLLSEEIYTYWYCRNRFADLVPNWRFLSHMYMSVMWAIYGAALMAAGFWRRSKILRYISLGLFALLLLKVFVLDTRTVQSVYRIAAFLATGITLVGVSYLYQFLKNKGFFDAMLSERESDK